MKLSHTLALTLTAVLTHGGFAFLSLAGEPSALLLREQAQVGGDGIFLTDLLAEPSPSASTHTRLGDAPAFGQATTLGRELLREALATAAPELAHASLAGADSVRITRRARPFDEIELQYLLTSVLQREYARDLGELELKFTRNWQTVDVPDGPLTLKVVELPTLGVTSSFIARFSLVAGEEVVGTWQMPVQAQIWREIWVARSPLRRGQLLVDADRVRERRDLLTVRDAFLGDDVDESNFEIAESVPAGMPLLRRSLKPRTLVRRGQVAEAVVRDGAMAVSLKVEVLEDGVRGQQVRVRNALSKREFRGKVEDEKTIVVNL